MCVFLSGTIPTAHDNGTLICNQFFTVSGTGVQRLAIFETRPSNFTLHVNENNILVNTDFVILVGNNYISGFREIIAHKNTIALVPTSFVSKALLVLMVLVPVILLMLSQ